MKIYALNFGWAGCKVVIAKSKEEAWKRLKEGEGFGNNFAHEETIDDVQEFEINEDFEYECLGDL